MLPSVLHKLQAAATKASAKDRMPSSTAPGAPPAATTALRPPGPAQRAA